MLNAMSTPLMSLTPAVSVKTAVKVPAFPVPPSIPPFADTEFEISCTAGAIHSPKGEPQLL